MDCIPISLTLRTTGVRFALREVDFAGRQRLDDVSIALLDIRRYLFRRRAIEWLRDQSAISKGSVERRCLEFSSFMLLD